MAGGGAAPPPKQDENIPHPVKDQLPNVSYCITSPPPWPEAILLGFQHYIVMLGTTVLIPSTLVPQMGGGKEEKAKVIQTLLFVAGLNTLTQTLFGTRLPAVIGGSYTFVPTTLSIVLAARYNDISSPQEKFERIMRGIQGAMIVASTLQIVIGFSGLWRNVTRLISPLSAIPLVAKCAEIGLPQLIILLIFSQYIPHLMKGDKHVFDRFAVIFSVMIVWVYAHILTVAGTYKNAPTKTQLSCRTDRAGIISGSPWIRVPYPFQWGAPTFDAGEAFAMMAGSFVALVESTGTFFAVSRYASATPIPPSVLSRGVGKFGAVFASIPAPIVAALYCLFFAYVGSAGLSFLQFCNLNSFRTKFILGFSIFMGLSIPQYFNEYTAINGYGPVHTRARWEEKAKVIQTLLFVAGLNTLTQTLFGTRLPAVIGGSYTFVPTTLSIVLAARYNDISSPQEKFERIMRGIQGAMIVASTLQIVIGFSGLWRNVTRLISPLSAIPLVALSGFGLYEFGFPLVAKCAEIGLPQLIILLIFSQSTGTFFAVSRYASATPIPPSVLSRGVGWQGVGILFSGIFGTGTGSSVSPENAGLLALTRVGSRRVVQISAGFMIFFSILGKFGAVFASIPAPIVAALYCLFFAYVGSAGLSFLQFCNLNSFRTKFILGFSIFMGLSIPQYFNEYTAINGYGPVHTRARWFNDMINVPFSSEPFVAGLLALFLDVSLHRKDAATRKDRGMPWWDKFKSFKTDTRSEEFYSLPFNLNKFFPSV
ncbi:hypothetical protein H5410_025889 [Solanum commersonii]|uniref:Uncharacterized protein n=1 Tax=Solanum commersonii TaxID=4109 RepID=A0A9J5YX51_SOLCO|nr:hypothetical protein H5410_025889 [Solanum commersonii]